MDWNAIGAVAGVVAGVLGAAFGMAMSVRNTRGPRERAFMIRANLIGGVAILGFVALVLAVPRPSRGFLFIAYVPLLILAVRRLNSRWTEIRNEEARASGPASHQGPPPPSSAGAG